MKKQILDAECKKIKLKPMVASLNYLKVKQEDFSLELLQKYEDMSHAT